jgi:hypothetical protein
MSIVNHNNSLDSLVGRESYPGDHHRNNDARVSSERGNRGQVPANRFEGEWRIHAEFLLDDLMTFTVNDRDGNLKEWKEGMELPQELQVPPACCNHLESVNGERADLRAPITLELKKKQRDNHGRFIESIEFIGLSREKN